MMDINKVVTQKELCYIAALNGAKRLEKQCYHYEAILQNTDKLIDVLNIDVKPDKYGKRYIDKTRILTSYGYQGNTGQMHLLEWYNNNNERCKCYVYYTNRNYNKD